MATIDWLDQVLNDGAPKTEEYINGIPAEEYHAMQLADMEQALEQPPFEPTEEDCAEAEARETALNYHENDPGVLYTFHNDQQLEDKEQSDIMYKLMKLQPHKSYIDFSWDDLGTATLFEEIYKDEVCYCPQKRDWYVWNKRWVRQSDAGAVTEKLQTLLHLLRLYVSEITEESKDDESALKKIEEYGKYISSIRKNTAMKNILDVVKTNLSVALVEFDTNPNLLNTPRGTINLVTWEKHDCDQDDKITMITSAPPLMGVDKPCDRWYSFIDEIMQGDAEKASFLQRALGYSILGVNKSECCFVAFGEKLRNGKGTLFDSVRAALGDEYAATGKSSMICEMKNGNSVDYNAPQAVLASYVGTRYLVMSEVPIDAIIDSSMTKLLTGRDRLKTRGLFESPFEYLPQFTMWLLVNHLPRVRDDGLFLSRRIWVIEFNKHFGEDEADEDLKETFQKPDTQRTIITWLIDGFNDYKKTGLNPPKCVRDATDRYKKLNDRIGFFLDDCCTEDEAKQTIRGELYNAYCRWCMGSDRKYKAMGSTTFYNELIRRGYRTLKNSDWVVQGLSLNDSQRIVL